MSSPFDLVGPVLPQALRLARYQASASLPQNAKNLQSENDMINQTPSREEERLLMSNANIMTALEDLFSSSEKDRTSRTSKLSRVESVRFQRAMYRIWLMSVLYGPRRFVPRQYGNLTNKEMSRISRLHESDLNKSWKDQKSFLRQFSSQELFQINTLARFLVSTASWAITAEGNGLGGTRETYDWNGMFLFAGPHIILRCYEEATTSHLPTEYLDDDGPYTTFLTRALSEIIQERHVTDSEPLGSVGTILDDINGEHDLCRHCGSGFPAFSGCDVRVLPNLYSETNWNHLKGWIEREYVEIKNLFSNPIESKPLTLALTRDWPKLCHQLFTCRGDEYSQWSKEDWICAECWTRLVRDTIWRYRLAQKKKAGEHIEKDCRYGYDCAEQRYESGLAHAQQFNHLCQPTEEAPNEVRW